MLKQNRLISTVSILGTALAIMMIMVIIMVQHINEMDMAPEINRSRILYLKNYMQKSRDTVNMDWNSGNLPYALYKQYLSEIKVPEKVSLITREQENAILTVEGANDSYTCSQTKTDGNYWKIISFDFIEGKPFDQTDYQSGLKKTVITEKIAKKLFGTSSAIGKTVNINYVPYTITGVVKDVSPVFTFSKGDLFVPLTSVYGYEGAWCVMLILAKDKSDFDAIKQEVRAAERRYEANNPKFTIDFWGPYDHRTQKDDINSGAAVDESKAPKRTLLILVILFLVPAINLSSFSMSQIKKRSEEIGIRKAFGAKKYTILIQVLYENLITSLIGGFIGLLLSYGAIIWLREWLLDFPEEGSIPAGAFISPVVFLFVFLSCIVLNLLSAGIPALRTLRMNIVESLKRK
jgi:putative ABC transport system permease protein